MRAERTHAFLALRVLFCVLCLAPAYARALMIGFHEVSSARAASPVSTIAVSVPANSRAGDVLLAAVSTRAGSGVTIATPAGWTLIRSDVNSTNLRVSLFYRVATAADAAAPSYSWTWSGGNARAVAVIVAYRGVDTSNPIDTSSGQTSAAASVVAPSVTPSSANAMLVGFFSAALDTSATPATGMRERLDLNTATGTAANGATIEIADENLNAAAATGTRTATLASAGPGIGQLVALRPQSTVPGPVVWYRMDEASWNGTTGEVKDSSGNALNGTALGGATTAAGIKCRAGSFSGSPMRVDVPYNGKQDMRSTFTVTGWIRPSAWPSSDLMSFFSKDTNYEFHITTTGQVHWWWGGGTRALFGSAGSAPLNQWTFVAFVFTRGSQAMYLGGAASAVSLGIGGTDNTQLTTNTNKLQIGDDQDLTGRRWRGLIDDIRVYDYALTQSEVDGVRTQTTACLVDHYAVTHAAAGVNCQAENITITAHDASHNAVTLNSSTQIALTAAYVAGAGGGSKGDWSIVTGGGTLNNGTADDGQATYTFAAGGETSVVLALKDTWAQTVNMVVSDGVATDTSGTAGGDTGYDQNLAFSAAGFRFLDPVTVAIPNQVAGVTSSSLALQAIESSACGPSAGPCTGVCTVPSAFANGANVTVDLASECVNPNTCQPSQLVTIANNGTSTIAANNNGSVGSYTAKSLLFGVNGTASFTLNYPDVGGIRLHARYNIPLGTGGASSNNMVGASNAFVVKPYTFSVSNVKRTSDAFANPAAANAAGGAFIGAGNAFTATVTALNAFNSASPNYGQESTPEGAILNSALAIGLGLTSNPAIANNSAFGTFNAGAATGTTFSWGEVGIITLSAGVADGDYLGAGDAAVVTQSGNVGRFIPDHFLYSLPLMTNRAALACSPASSFSYMGEGIGLQFTLIAANLAGGTTSNYTTANGFAKLPSTAGTSSPASTLGFGAVSGSFNLTSRVTDLTSNPTLTWTAGQVAVNAQVAIARGISPDGPYATLKLGIAPSDQDSVRLQTSAFTMDVDGVGGNDHAQIGVDTAVRFGRLRIFNAVGSDLIDLPVAFETQYWNGTGFITNAADSCTPLSKGDVAFANWQKNLTAPAANGACRTGFALSPATVTFTNGRASLKLSRPGPNIFGSVDLAVDLGASAAGRSCPAGSDVPATTAGRAYLQGAWGGAATYDQNPTARASFGLYRGAGDFIYFRENY